jgi:hypothetical protein
VGDVPPRRVGVRDLVDALRERVKLDARHTR